MQPDLRSNFLLISKEWEDYGEEVITKSGASVTVTDVKDPLYTTITKNIPSDLSSINDKKPFHDILLSKGSPGEGNKSLAPWIATFNTDLTISAKKEFYVVYLYSGDLKNLYLSIAFGVTSFETLFGRGKKSLEAIRSAASKKRNLSMNLAKEIFNERTLNKVISSPIDVARGHYNFLHRAYGEGAIFSLEYDLDDLPDNNILIEDYEQILDLYIKIENDVSIPSVEEFAVSEVSEENKELTISSFEVREPRKAKGKSNPSDNTENEGRRKSKKSNLIGNKAEETVFEYEKEKIKNLKLDREVIWCAKNPKDRKPGYDVLSFNQKGEEIYIEVKATEGKNMTSVNLTANEWRVANLASHKNNYFIYLVYEALTKPRIEVISNPSSMVEEGKLEIKISDYDLRLNPASEY